VGRLKKNIAMLLAIFVLFLQTTFFVSTAYADDSPEYWLQKMGFSPVANEPIDFSLPLLSSGQEEKLSSLKGKWIFLVFWATWCAPCREELPALENFKGSFVNSNLVIRGVSIDNGDSTPVKKFIKENHLTFSMWHDQDGQVAAQYQANSVPSMYVISPDWKIVGIMRGARDWQTPEIAGWVKELLKFEKVEVVATPISSQGGFNQIELPNNLIPPYIEIKIPKGQQRVGEIINVEVAVAWHGDAYRYVFKTPTLALDSKIKVGDVFSTSSSDVKGSVLRYIYPLTIPEAGAYKIGPAELSFSPREGGKELFSRSTAVDISVELTFIAKFGWIILLLLFIIGGVIWFLYKKYKQKMASTIFASQAKEAKIAVVERWERIQAGRVQVARRDYCVELLAFYVEVVGVEVAKVESMINEIRYAGQELSNEELSYYEKQIVRALSLNSELEE